MKVTHAPPQPPDSAGPAEPDKLAQSSYAQIAAQPSPFTSDDPNAVVPGELLTEPPTLINLGFEWLIQGDENRNARSRYRIEPGKQLGRMPYPC